MIRPPQNFWKNLTTITSLILTAGKPCLLSNSSVITSKQWSEGICFHKQAPNTENIKHLFPHFIYISIAKLYFLSMSLYDFKTIHFCQVFIFHRTFFSWLCLRGEWLSCLKIGIILFNPNLFFQHARKYDLLNKLLKQLYFDLKFTSKGHLLNKNEI